MPPPRQLQSPIILTLRLDKATHQLLTSLRSKYFPPHRNFLSAHVTLFHAIPSHRFDELDENLNKICNSKSGWDVFFGEPEKMGNRGVYLICRERPSNSVEKIHRELLSNLKKGIKSDQDKLTNQDLQTMRKPHVTVLNKASNEEQVDICLKEVKEFFEGMRKDGQKEGQHKGRAVGFEVWEYLGGPWKSIKEYTFQGEGEGSG
ncbi:uncharacterized protein I206_107863 [Kwoniella pini CBS 10737]|uniref:2',3'-cyclic-nucleotide 3'-phosphodiesterase n=1 Tax=Kwoniella pini CBS 10737 TaxID=1296096 RepID=A0A1B9HYI2_9TREE|nr:uncharacterized protein I206_06194 [Kwoniella pini CBS 10737]OCF48326.1 hypothetical protein I206_06194 [Kwoniella pini CBS 10737]